MVCLFVFTYFFLLNLQLQRLLARPEAVRQSLMSSIAISSFQQ
jgi:hypothetical protein